MACEYCDIEIDSDPTYPAVTVDDRWVAVQWHDRAPFLVLADDGSVTERFTLPTDVPDLPLAAACPNATAQTTGGSA